MTICHNKGCGMKLKMLREYVFLKVCAKVENLSVKQ